MSTDSVAADQIRAFVDRILRLKEEAKSINDDVKEVYAEAKGNGFDKTQLGKLVNYVEKRAKDPNAVSEGEAIFGLYLAAYDGAPSHTHAYAREDEPEHDAETGEVTERSGGALDARLPPKQEVAGSNPAQIANSGAPALSPSDPLRSDAAEGDEAGVGAPEAIRDAQEQPRATSGLSATTSSAGTEGEADRQPIPDISKPNPICRDPDDCGVYASWHMPCLNCQRAASLRSAA